MTESILNFLEKYTESDAIKSYEYNEYQPTSGSNLNISGNITIHIENQDEFFHPRRSYLLVEGNLLKAGAGGIYAGNAAVALANFGVMHLFSNAKYELAGQEIESVNNPGIAGVLMGTAKFPYDYATGAGMIQCWSPQTSDAVLGERGFARRQEYIIAKSVPRGSFSFIVELENLFGFCEDYDKVVYGMRQKLTLVRKNDDDAIQRIRAAGAGKVELTKVAWVMPRVHPNDVKKFSLYKSIEEKVVVDAAFRMRQCSSAEIPPQSQTFDWRLGVRTAPEKPRHLLIAFQSNKSGDQEKNPSQFDHLSATEVSVILNDTKYPARDVIADFPKHKYVEYYKMFTDFSREYYGLDPLTVSNFVDIVTYKEEFPIFYIDVSKQSERISQSVVDIKVKMRFAGNVGANVVAHALLISDRRLKFQSDGRKMNVIY